MLKSPISIRSLEIPNRAILAPLAGVSDVPFRRICQELGAGFTFIEMLAANAILYGSKQVMRCLDRHDDEPLLGVQLTGKTAAEVGHAVEKLSLGPYDLIDINMGCPTKKVVGKGSGSAILQDLNRVAETVRFSRAATDKPLSVKVRLGFCRNTVVIHDLAELIINEGADMLTIHGRTRSENYSVPVDYKGVQSGVESAHEQKSQTPVMVGNGDIMDYASAKEMVDHTGCDAIMVSRGALGNPWIFREILTQSPPRTTIEEWLKVALRHIDYHAEHYGDTPITAALFRKHLLWYVNGFPGIKALREELSTVEHLDEARRKLESFASSIPPNFIRYDESAGTRFVMEKRAKNYDPKYEMDRDLDRGIGHQDA